MRQWALVTGGYRSRPRCLAPVDLESWAEPMQEQWAENPIWKLNLLERNQANSALDSSRNKKDQEALAARAACWLTICSFIFCCISLGVGCAM